MTQTTKARVIRCSEYDDPGAQCGACDAGIPRKGPWHSLDRQVYDASYRLPPSASNRTIDDPKPAPQVIAECIILRCYTCIEFNRKFHTHSITESSVLPGDIADWANLHKSAGHDVREVGK